jgi:hypothetical protein
MTRTAAEAVLVGTQAVQVLFLLMHDWVPLGRLSNLEAVHALDSRRKLIPTTLLSALPYAIGLAFCVAAFPHWPASLRVYLEWLYTISLGAVLWAWWVPYFSKSDSARAQRYRTRFAGTISFLPKRHGFSPDLLHTAYHAAVLATWALLFLY